MQEERRNMEKSFVKNTDYTFSDTESRIRYIITRLLRSGKFIRIEQLADELFVSRATVDRLMPEIKANLEEYSLRIVTRPKYGIRIQGDEIKKRLCYAHCANTIPMENQAELIRQVQLIVLDVVKRYDLTINDINLYNLIRHCGIAIFRMASGNQITEDSVLTFDGPVDKERQAARELLVRFEAAFGVEIPGGEVQYMIMHLLGKRSLKQFQTLNVETLECINHVLEEIRREKGIDLSGDAELYTALALHTQPLLSRLRFGLKQENPILQDIKRDMSQAYELAVCAVQVLHRDLELDMSEDEAGYLAIHFAVALEKRESVSNDWKVVVVCASGRGTAKIICHRLVDRYRFKRENLILSSVFELEDQNFDNILCIFSTVPLPRIYPVPTVMVDLAMNNKSLERVDDFLRSASHPCGNSVLPLNTLIFSQENCSTREEVLDFLCAQMEQTFFFLSEGEGDFTLQVKRREELSSTEVGNQVAMPHPYAYQGKVGAVAFLSLKKAIPWKFGRVRLVILLAVSEESAGMNGLMDALPRLVTNEEIVRRLAKNLNRSTLEECLQEGGREV